MKYKFTCYKSAIKISIILAILLFLGSSVSVLKTMASVTEFIGADGLYAGDFRDGANGSQPVTPLPVAVRAGLDFIVHGDTHAGDNRATAVHKELIKRFLEYKPGSIFNVGDLVHGQWGGQEIGIFFIGLPARL